MAAPVTYASAVSLSLILILSVSHLCNCDLFSPLNPKQLKEACEKTPHPRYCLDLIKARVDNLMTYHIYSPEDMAQYLMSVAAGIGHELTALARAERDRLPARRRRCMEKLAAGFDTAATKLDIVDGALLDDSSETFQLVYRFVRSNAAALAEDWNACPGTGVMASKHKSFAMLLDVILPLGKLPDPRCMVPPSSRPFWCQ